jgi:hypothetical protein
MFAYFFYAKNRIHVYSTITVDRTVIIPMVLQIRETMVLQRVERKRKGNPPHFCVFGLPAAPMRKHGFAEKLHQK